MKTTPYTILFFLASARLVFERYSESKYTGDMSAMSCNSRSCCFNNEQLDKLDKEFGVVDGYSSLPLGYDPVEWGWELTGFSIGIHVFS